MISLIKRLTKKDKAAADASRILSGTLSEIDMHRINKAKTDSTEYQDDLTEIFEAYDSIEELSNDPLLMSLVEQDSYKIHVEKIKLEQSQNNQSFNLRSKMAIVASILVVMTMVFLVNIQIGDKVNSNSLVRYSTIVGEQKTIKLSDGSVITLNTSSQILVDMQDNKRLITLDRGEVYFDVASDSMRPFSVDLDGRVVTVLGTAFNIVKATEGFTVAVTEGIVSIHRENETASFDASKIILDTDEEITVSDSTQRQFGVGMVAKFDVQKQFLSAHKVEDISRLVDWKSGVLRFENILLSKVVLDLNRYSKKKILVTDATLMNLKVSASIKTGDINNALSIFEQALPIKVIHQYDHILIVTP